MSVLIDPVAVAEKVLATDRGWSRTSVFEIKAMAGYILYCEERDNDPEQPQPLFEADGLHMVPMAPSDARAVHIRKLVEDVQSAFTALESARFSARERACASEFERALKALSNAFGTEITNAEY
tara:strand:- start:48244 stop:48615 length:372 start_codon:yes stop_codon:yes gene_type:complete